MLVLSDIVGEGLDRPLFPSSAILFTHTQAVTTPLTYEVSFAFETSVTALCSLAPSRDNEKQIGQADLPSALPNLKI